MLIPRSASNWVHGTGDVNPGMPPLWNPGDLLVIFTCCYATNETLATPSGWTAWAPGTPAAASLKAFARIAVAGDTSPAINWSSTSRSEATMLAFNGDVWPTLATMLHQALDRASSNTNSAPFPAMTPTVDNCFLLYFGRRNKSVAIDGLSPVTSFTTMPAGATYIDDDFYAGDFSVCSMIAGAQQTTAAAVSADVATLNHADSAQNCQGLLLALRTQTAVVLPGVSAVGTITDGSSFTITGVGFSGSGNSVTIGGVAQTITSQSTTSITCTAVLGSLMYATDYALVVTNSSSQVDPSPPSVQIGVSATKEFVTLQAPLVPVDQRLTAVPDLQPGWQVELSNVTGGFTVADVQLYHDGEWIATPASYTFDIRVNDGVNGWSAVATQSISEAPPVITGDPQNQSVVVGSTATFSISYTGTVTGFQWYKNGSAISGATAQTYTTPNAITGDNGALFFCRATNTAGYDDSASAVLTVALATLPLRNDVWDGSLPGLTINRSRAYLWNTGIQTSMSGKESRVRLMQYPRVNFTLQYELLRDNLDPSELKAIFGLFNASGGACDTFLYRDPDFNRVTLEKFGTGDGSTVAFQLIASFQNNGGVGGAELIQNLNGVPIIYQNGAVVSTSAYTINPLGLVTFTSARPAAAELRWSGDFYYRVRFSEDTLEMTQFMDQWWQSKQITLRSIKL